MKHQSGSRETPSASQCRKEDAWCSADTSRHCWSCFAALFVAALALNWPWEMLQMPAYTEMAGRPWQETALRCTVASLGDVAATLAIYGVGALAAGQLRWGKIGRWKVYATAALLGAVCAVAYEWYSLSNGRWSYTDRMPIVPVLRVGLWPVLQLTLLVPAALWIARWCAKRRQRVASGVAFIAAFEKQQHHDDRKRP